MESVLFGGTPPDCVPGGVDPLGLVPVGSELLGADSVPLGSESVLGADTVPPTVEGTVGGTWVVCDPPTAEPAVDAGSATRQITRAATSAATRPIAPNAHPRPAVRRFAADAAAPQYWQFGPTPNGWPQCGHMM
ncbi:MAG: hypothetical protein ACR2P2_14870 [Nakamurella sp.]